MENSQFIELDYKSKGLEKELRKKVKGKYVIFRHGHIAITDVSKDDLFEFKKMLSVWSKTQFKYERVGYYYVKKMRELRVNRGFDQALLRQHFPDRKFIVDNDAIEADKIDIELTTPPRSDFQKVGLTFMASKEPYTYNKKFTQLMIGADTGEGKCQPNDTMIPTPGGWKRLDSLKVGDMVFNWFGYPVKVLGIFPQKKKMDTYQITFIDGRSTRCNDEHLWKVTGAFTHITRVVSLKELINLRKSQEYYILLTPTNYDEQPVSIEPELFGTMIRNNTDSVNYIPNEYKFNSIENRLHLLLGIFGSNNYCYVSTEQMKDDIVEIIYSTGKLARVEQVPHGWYRITIIQSNKLYIKSIEKLYKQTSQRCILIDDPDHIYLTEHYIPTHNTYLGVATTAYFQRRALIIVPYSKLLDQWKQSYLNFTTLTENDILIVQGSKMCQKIIDGKYDDKKVFITIANTLDSFQKTAGDTAVYDFYCATRAYIKIVDEVHKNMAMIQKLDALSNFHMNYYMSASPGRSENKENWIFSKTFANVPKFGLTFKTDEEKHIQVMIKKYMYLPSSRQINRIVNKKVGMNTKTYETELRASPPDSRKSFEDSYRIMLNWTKENLQKKCKVIVLAYTIDFLHYLHELSKDIFGDDIGVYYGGLKKDEKEEALNHTLIIATSSSLGTGADIAGLQFAINTTTYSNWIETKQVSGRLRKIDGVNQVYIELVNFGWYKTVKQFEKRKKYLVNRSKTGKLIVVN